MDIKKAFRVFGWTLERVAARLRNRDGSMGITPSCLSQSISSGALSLKRLQEIASIMGIPLWQLIETAESKRTHVSKHGVDESLTGRIKGVLKKHGWTMSLLASKMKGRDGKVGISQGGLSRMLNGNPTIEKIKEISEVTGIPIPEFFTPSDSLTAMVEFHGKIYKATSVAQLRALVDSFMSC